MGVLKITSHVFCCASQLFKGLEHTPKLDLMCIQCHCQIAFESALHFLIFLTLESTNTSILYLGESLCIELNLFFKLALAPSKITESAFSVSQMGSLCLLTIINVIQND